MIKQSISKFKRPIMPSSSELIFSNNQKEGHTIGTGATAVITKANMVVKLVTAMALAARFHVQFSCELRVPMTPVPWW